MKSGSDEQRIYGDGRRGARRDDRSFLIKASLEDQHAIDLRDCLAATNKALTNEKVNEKVTI